MRTETFKNYKLRISRLLDRNRVIKRRQCLEHDFVPIPAGSATKARPGTWEKMEVMRARWSLGQQLYHPDDA